MKILVLALGIALVTMSALPQAFGGKSSEAKVRKSSPNPEQASLRPEFVVRARAALKAINKILPEAHGVSGFKAAQRLTEGTVEGLRYTVGEQIVWRALDDYLLARMQDEFAVAPAGVLPPPNSAITTQQILVRPQLRRCWIAVLRTRSFPIAMPHGSIGRVVLANEQWSVTQLSGLQPTSPA